MGAKASGWRTKVDLLTFSGIKRFIRNEPVVWHGCTISPRTFAWEDTIELRWTFHWRPRLRRFWQAATGGRE